MPHNSLAVDIETECHPYIPRTRGKGLVANPFILTEATQRSLLGIRLAGDVLEGPLGRLEVADQLGLGPRAPSGRS